MLATLTLLLDETHVSPTISCEIYFQSERPTCVSPNKRVSVKKKVFLALLIYEFFNILPLYCCNLVKFGTFYFKFFQIPTISKSIVDCDFDVAILSDISGGTLIFTDKYVRGKLTKIIEWIITILSFWGWKLKKILCLGNFC